MSQEVFKAPKAKRKHGSHHKRETERWSPKKKRRTKDDFFTFCNIVLEYTQYDTLKQEEMRRCNNTSPLDSGGSTADSFTSESTSSSISEPEHDEKIPIDSSTPQMVKAQSRSNHSDSSDSECHNSGAEDDSWELVTCFCLKPFSGRPMIECSECLTWIHLSCAKIRKSNIPDDFICQKCRESKFTTRKSCRIRSEKKLMNA